MKGKLVILQWRMPAKYHLTQVIERNIISNARDQYVVMMLKTHTHTHTHTHNHLFAKMQTLNLIMRKYQLTPN